MTVINRIIAAFCVAAILLGAAQARSFVTIPSLDSGDALLSEEKRPPKCVFIWGAGFPKAGETGPGSVTVRAARNQYSGKIEQLARDGGVLPVLIASDEEGGKRVTFELKNVRVKNFQIISAGPEAKPRGGGADVLQQEWSLVYETIQRVN